MEPRGGTVLRECVSVDCASTLAMGSSTFLGFFYGFLRDVQLRTNQGLQ